MDELQLELFWNDIPIGAENAITYEELIRLWDLSDRKVRKRLQALSILDNGDNYVLVRSGANRGFYRTDNLDDIGNYKNECLRKGKSIFAPVKKINRILMAETAQFNLENNLRVVRESRGLKQIEVCRIMEKYDKVVDTAMLSKFENGACLPTPYQLSLLADIYGCEASELVNYETLLK